MRPNKKTKGDLEKRNKRIMEFGGEGDIIYLVFVHRHD